jgi:hypothetical protein
VLGSAIYGVLKADPTNEILGLSFSQAKPGLKQLDLMDKSATEAVFEEFSPDCTKIRF